MAEQSNNSGAQEPEESLKLNTLKFFLGALQEDPETRLASFHKALDADLNNLCREFSQRHLLSTEDKENLEKEASKNLMATMKEEQNLLFALWKPKMECIEDAKEMIALLRAVQAAYDAVGAEESTERKDVVEEKQAIIELEPAFRLLQIKRQREGWY